MTSHGKCLARPVVAQIAGVPAREKEEAIGDEHQGDIVLVHLAVVLDLYSLMQAAGLPIARGNHRIPTQGILVRVALVLQLLGQIWMMEVVAVLEDKVGNGRAPPHQHPLTQFVVEAAVTFVAQLHENSKALVSKSRIFIALRIRPLRYLPLLARMPETQRGVYTLL